MSNAGTARARSDLRVPSHGQGLLATWRPGQSGNPSGKHRTFKEIRAYCREKSLPAARALAAIVEDVDPLTGLPNQDGRVVVVAAQTLMTWGHGKPPDYDPNEDKPKFDIDTSKLSLAQMKAFVTTLDKVLTLPPEEPEPVPEEMTAAPVSSPLGVIEGHVVEAEAQRVTEPRKPSHCPLLDELQPPKPARRKRAGPKKGNKPTLKVGKRSAKSAKARAFRAAMDRRIEAEKAGRPIDALPEETEPEAPPAPAHPRLNLF